MRSCSCSDLQQEPAVAYPPILSMAKMMAHRGDVHCSAARVPRCGRLLATPPCRQASCLRQAVRPRTFRVADLLEPNGSFLGTITPAAARTALKAAIPR